MTIADDIHRALGWAEDCGDRDLARRLRVAISTIKAMERASAHWQPIESAPKETEILVGRFVNNQWRICQSGFYYDAGMNTPDGYEPAYWYWCCDWDRGGVTDDEGPSHWMPLPIAPERT